jgi:hypothetical protein
MSLRVLWFNGLIDHGFKSRLSHISLIFLCQNEQKIEKKYDEQGVQFCQLSSKSQPNLVTIFLYSSRAKLRKLLLPQTRLDKMSQPFERTQ